jgi:ADP-ribose pyrophosphatase YjhB (NUDIX family)
VHPIQSHILKKLTLHEKARFTDLKPAGIESNKLIYHLHRLERDGIIEKSSALYSLSPRGIRFVARLSLKSFTPRAQPKIVTVTIVQNRRGEYLLTTQKRQPFFGLTTFPFGKIHFGETMAQAAQRELREKSGLSARLVHCGDTYLAIRERGELVSHMFCHVFYGMNPKGELIPEHRTHNVYWESIEGAKKKFVRGFLELNKLRLRSKHKRFFKEITA